MGGRIIMTTRGRKPNVTSDNKVSRKTKENLKNIEDNTPVYESQNFIPPKTLDKDELEVWNDLVAIFRQTINCRVSDADRDLMELYCKAKATANKTDTLIKQDPRAYIPIKCGDKEVYKPNPYYKLRKENSELCLKFFDQLGLSPLARARVGVKGANAKQEVDIFNLLNNRSDD